MENLRYFVGGAILIVVVVVALFGIIGAEKDKRAERASLESEEKEEVVEEVVEEDAPVRSVEEITKAAISGEEPEPVVEEEEELVEEEETSDDHLDPRCDNKVGYSWCENFSSCVAIWDDVQCPEEEEEEVVDTGPDMFLKQGESLGYGGHKVVLEELIVSGGTLSTVISVDGIDKSVTGDSGEILINGLIVRLGRYVQLESEIELKISQLELEDDEYLFSNYGEASHIVGGELIILRNVLDNGKAILDMQTSGILKVEVPKGGSKTVVGLEIEHVKAFTSGYANRREVILKIVEA